MCGFPKSSCETKKRQCMVMGLALVNTNKSIKDHFTLKLYTKGKKGKKIERLYQGK